MKKLLIMTICSLQINAQPIVTSEMILESVGSAIKAGGQGIAQTARYATDTQTPEEKCNSQWWKHFKEYNHEISVISKENEEMKQILTKNKINYAPVIKQKMTIIEVNENELREKSCSEEDFKQVLINEKRIKEVKKENEALKEMMSANGLENKKIVYLIKEENKEVRNDAKENLLKEMSN